MATNTNSKSKKTGQKAPAKNTVKNTKTTVKENEIKEEIKEKPVEEIINVEEPVKEVDPAQYVTVLNGFQGKLTYKSSRTGEKFKWEDFGDEQEIELRELRNAKNSNKKYFEKNWFMFNDEFSWVIDYLGVGQYYKNAISVEDFDDIFTKDSKEIKEIVEKLSDGQKKAVVYRAKALIDEGEIDSLKTIDTLEKVFGIKLTEKYE